MGEQSPTAARSLATAQFQEAARPFAASQGSLAAPVLATGRELHAALAPPARGRAFASATLLSGG
jgi:hypothetical protein